MAKTVSPPAQATTDSAHGWMVVAATFVSTFTVFGVVYSFGTFFRSMADDFGSGKGATTFMFSVTTCWYFLFGLITSHAADRWGPRPVMIVGAVSLTVGMLATSRVDSIGLGYVTYGVLVGTTVACAYVPMVATVGGWFIRQRTAALGIAVSGIGVGTLVGAPVAERLIDSYGWRQAFVILGVAGGALLLIASIGAHRPPIHIDQPAIPLRSLIHNQNFVVLYIGAFLCSLGLFVPFVFLADYAEGRGIAPSRAAALVAIIGAASVIGRLGLGGLGGRLDALRLMQFSFAMLSGSFVIWLVAGSSYTLLVIFAIVMGVGYGGFIALSPAVAATLFSPTGLGGLLGALYTAAGFGGLIGPPLAGAIIDAASYRAAIGFALVLTGASAAVTMMLPRPGAR